ncbi:MAG: RagB/SusD family nutrient uptake outer membrane protein [Agriterribacter sp.]
MKKILFVIITAGLMLSSCKKGLDEAPQGVVSGDDLNTPENIDKMVIAAYSALGNDHYTSPYSSLWPYGSVRGGDTYKGGDGPGDLSEFHLMETFSLNRVDNGLIDELWYRLYVDIGRANEAPRRLNEVGTDVFPNKTTRQAEVRFLRGHFYFLSKILFKRIPYIDETIDKASYDTVSNRSYSNDALWEKIAEDFRFASANLPESQEDVGRPDKYTASAYLAKVLLYAAYKQDDNNAVTSVDAGMLTEVNTLCDAVINSGKYSLNTDFAYNFLTAHENSRESVFAIQYSKDDGTPKGRLDYGHALNYPMNQEYGCCGFNVPSHDLINAFKTGADGLPMFNNYNDNDVAASGNYQTGTFDERLDHTVAKPGYPYKYKTDFLFQKSWARAPEVYGAFASLKEAVLYDDASFQKVPPFMSSSKNWNIIRYADVLLFKAEALIELGKQNEAVSLINQLRTRAASSATLLVQANGNPTSHYGVSTYQPGVNCTWTQEYARQALRWERHLEFATEGYHFFDLVRWGVTAETMTAYFSVEKTRSSHLSDAKFTKGRDEYFPIPLNQINYSRGLYQQNTGW